MERNQLNLVNGLMHFITKLMLYSLIDYNAVEKLAVENKPKLIIAGGSAYSRIIDFKNLGEICDKVGAYLLVDMAHLSGLKLVDIS